MLKDAALRLLRTSSFRLAIQSAILSAFGAVLVFAIIYHASENAVRAELDSTVSSEAADVISDAKDDASFLKSVQIATAESDGTFYALTTADGTEIAGNVAMSPRAAQRWTSWRTMKGKDGIKLPPASRPAAVWQRSSATAIRSLSLKTPAPCAH